MKLKEMAGNAVQAQKEMGQRLKEQRTEAALRSDEIDSNPQYLMEVNKGSMNMAHQTHRLNQMWHSGWKLHTALEQNGNTVFIFERIA